MSVYTSNDNELCCPLCGDVFVHIDQVRVAARPKGEDGPEIDVGLTASGALTLDATPTGRAVGAGRRHRIALLGWCEMCGGKFALVFTQHKGVTFVESVEMPPADAEVHPLPVQRAEEPLPVPGESAR